MSGYPQSDTGRLEPGLKLDRYELLCMLAQGGMGAVWLARLTGKHGFEKVVAVKTVLPEHAPHAQYRSMFLDEARLASRIAHPNVAQTLDLGDTNGTLYFVMEWVDGDSLRKLRGTVEEKGEPFPVNLALRIISEACGDDLAQQYYLGKYSFVQSIKNCFINTANNLLRYTGRICGSWKHKCKSNLR